MVKSMKSEQGFTLLELMVVVAIIAILASIAVLQYQTYVAKSEFSESQTIADGLKTTVVKYFNETGTCPTNGNGGVAAPTSYQGKYVATVTTGGNLATGCTISVKFKAVGSVAGKLAGKTVIITGVNNEGTFSWVCDKSDASGIAAKYKPRACIGN